jgi:RNA polymerase sigma factor (sigma-70 family)
MAGVTVVELVAHDEEAGHLTWDPERETTLAEHEGAVRRYCRSRVDNDADAEDAAQDTFLRFLQSKGEIRNPEAWLIHAASCACKDLLRRAIRQQTWPIGEAEASSSPDPADIVVEVRSTEQLLERLRAPDRDLLEKLYMKGLTVQQVASLLRISPGNVRVMALRARRRASDVFAAMHEGVGALALVPGLRAAWRETGAQRGRVRDRLELWKRSVTQPQHSPFWSGAAQLLLPVTVAGLVLGSVSSNVAPGRPGLSGASSALSEVSTAGGGSWGSDAPPGAGASLPNGGLPAGRGARSGSTDLGGLVGSFIAPGQNAKQEDASFSSLTVSPNYSQDRTVFASGNLVYGCASTCSTVFRSQDGGTSWHRLTASNFAGGTILLPPTFPTDSTIFSIGPAGLQRSDDSGATFGLVLPGATHATIAPESRIGDATVVIGGQPLVVYHAGSAQVTLGPTLPTGMTSVNDLAFGPEGANVIVTGIQTDASRNPVQQSVSAVCQLGGQCGAVTAYAGEPALQLIASSPHGRRPAIFAFSDSSLHRSQDNGLSFVTLQPPGPGRLVSLAPAPDYADTQLLSSASLFGAGAGQGSTFARSSNGGLSFSRLAPAGFGSGHQVARLAVLPDQRILVALSITDSHDDFGLRCSSDGGQTWARGC